MKPDHQKHAVVLLSGGLDSATTLAQAKAEGYICHALTIRYGQRHQHELEAAMKVANALNIEDHKVLELDLRLFGGSALTSDTEVPKDRNENEIGHGIPVTYVPARNTIFLSLALAWAETLNAFDLFLGVNCTDYSGYPDCRPEYLRSFEEMANLATAAGVERRGRFKIHAPLLLISKADTIILGLQLGLDYGLTHTCYDPAPNGNACGHCDACQIRLAAFREVGMEDPVPYSQ
jgi:7-cyano-7-deazaguanine synthase